MIDLDPPSQRWLIRCDGRGCAACILASEGTHTEQRAELDRLASDLGWRRTTDVGDYCRACAVVLAPPIPRESVCTKDAWCLAAEGHGGKCVVAEKRAMPAMDLSHRTVRKRWG